MRGTGVTEGGQYLAGVEVPIKLSPNSQMDFDAMASWLQSDGLVAPDFETDSCAWRSN
jgi:hypothetical protein